MVAIWFVYSHKANNLRLGVRVEQDFLVDCRLHVLCIQRIHRTCTLLSSLSLECFALEEGGL